MSLENSGVVDSSLIGEIPSITEDGDE